MGLNDALLRVLVTIVRSYVLLVLTVPDFEVGAKMKRARRWIVPGASRVEESGWLISQEENSMLRSIYLLTCALFLMPAPASAETVNVLYAGSLVNLIEHGIGPAFDKATGDTYQGFAGGSNGLANQIKGQLRRGDVLISANPKMSDDFRGAAKGTSSTGFHDWGGPNSRSASGIT